MNSYVDLGTLKAVGGLNITGTTENARLRKLVEAYSRNIDAYVGRHFYSRTQTRYFSGNGRAYIALPWDLIAVTTLKEDSTGDAVYDTTWAAADYILAPYEAAPTGVIDLAAPYTRIEVDERSTGSQSAFRKAQRAFELAGRWGWAESTRTATETLNEVLDTTEVGVDVSARADIEIGHTILIESEQMYVESYSSNTLTVRRAVNGTTAATHATALAISIIEYPSDVREAIIIEASRMWAMKNSSFASSVGFPDTGQVQVFGGQLQPRSRSLLDPYRRVNV